MYKLILVYSLFVFKCFAKADCNPSDVIDYETRKVVDFKEFCLKPLLKRPCILRRCGPDSIFFKNNKEPRQCMSLKDINKSMETSIEMPSAKIYRIYDDEARVLSSKDFYKDFRHIAYVNESMYSSECTQGVLAELPKLGNAFALIEDGSLSVDDKQLDPSHVIKTRYLHYGVEFVVRNSSNKLMKPVKLVFLLSDTINRQSEAETIFFVVALLVSTFFFILIVVVYVLVVDFTLVAYTDVALVSSLALGYGVKGIQIICLMYGVIQSLGCFIACLIWYFGFIASFFWINVMAVGVYRNLCFSKNRTALSQRGDRRKNLRKFGYYCLYAFGVPLLLTITAIVIDLVELPNGVNIIKPDFGSCFPSQSNVYYLYVPISFMVFVNFIVFLVILYCYYKLQKGLDRDLNSSNSRNTKRNHRFYLYIRLVAITGTTWLLDLIELVVDLPKWLSHIVNCNLFLGIPYFIHLVCNERMRKLIRRRLFGETTNYSLTSTHRPSEGYLGKKKLSTCSRNTEVSAD